MKSQIVILASTRAARPNRSAFKDMMRYAVLGFIITLSGCTSVQVTPKSIRNVNGRAVEQADALKRWGEAVSICNEFLSSDYRKTLPKGDMVLEASGMTFISADARLPVRIRCGVAGDLLIPFHMIAQERSDGFVVGALPPREHRELDNSFFKHRSGSWQENYQMAGLILHEVTHSHFKLGTVSFPKTVRYYAEAVFLFRYRSHSMERLPFQTSSEFSAFVQAHFSQQKEEAQTHPLSQLWCPSKEKLAFLAWDARVLP